MKKMTENLRQETEVVTGRENLDKGEKEKEMPIKEGIEE